MSVDSESFLKLCQELRALGAQTVEGYGFRAVFPPVAQAPQPLPRKPASKQDAGDPKTDAELRELQRKHELGLA